MTKILVKKVVVRLGLFGYGLSLVWLAFGIGLLSISLRLLLQPSNGQLTLADTLLTMLILAGFIVAGGAFLWLALMLLRQRYVISLEGVDVRRLRNSRFVRWEEVKALGEVPVLWLSSGYYLTPKAGKGIALYTSFMARPRQSAKALIEAAYLSGANIEFKFVFGNELGPPPYGIFKEARKTNA